MTTLPVPLYLSAIPQMSAIPTNPEVAQLMFKAIAWFEQRTGLTAQASFTTGETWDLYDAATNFHVLFFTWMHYIVVKSAKADGIKLSVFSPWFTIQRQMEMFYEDLDR